MSSRILIGDCLERLAALPAESIHCRITSPPYYGLRCYGVDGQIGLESTPEEHIAKLVEVFREVRRVLRKDGVLWLNYGDAYAGGGNGGGGSFAKDGIRDALPGTNKNKATRHGSRSCGNGLKPKDLLMMPARVALALQADGWWLRSMMPWVKRSAMPESVTDRPATAIEYLFLLAKSQKYFFDMEAVRQADLGTDHVRNVLHKPEPSGGIMPPHDGIRKATGRNGGGRNFRNSDLFYASLAPPHGLICGDEPLALDVNPAAFSESHFATFPPKLVEPLIKAGTSEKGVCAACGAPWVREVEINDPEGRLGKGYHDHTNDAGLGQRGVFSASGAPQKKTTGWSPACACHVMRGPVSETVGQPNEPVPATVLDPFGGAGTVALVADRLGRDAVLIELNPEYAEMARRRIEGDAGLFAEVGP